MVSIESMRKLALSFPDVEEKPHFEKTSFRVKNRIFATLDVMNKRACLKLSAVQQSVFSSHNTRAIYPVPNAWGKQGWTFVELARVRNDMFKDALATAYQEVAGKGFSGRTKKQRQKP
jgi:hypothetical protein